MNPDDSASLAQPLSGTPLPSVNPPLPPLGNLPPLPGISMVNDAPPDAPPTTPPDRGQQLDTLPAAALPPVPTPTVAAPRSPLYENPDEVRLGKVTT